MRHDRGKRIHRHCLHSTWPHRWLTLGLRGRFFGNSSRFQLPKQRVWQLENVYCRMVVRLEKFAAAISKPWWNDRNGQVSYWVGSTHHSDHAAVRQIYSADLIARHSIMQFVFRLESEAVMLGVAQKFSSITLCNAAFLLLKERFK